MEKARAVYVWKDPSGVTLDLTILMVLKITIHLASLGVCIAYGEAASYTGREGAFSSAQLLRWAIDCLQIGFYLPCIVVLFWIARVSRNAHTFQAGLKNSPRGAVGWYFVPFASLYKPFEAMSEIWSASSAPGESRKAPLLNWWWGLFLVSSLVGIVSWRIETGASPVRMLWDSLAIAVSVILILMARRLNRMQRAKHEWSVFDAPDPEPLGVLQRVSS